MGTLEAANEERRNQSAHKFSVKQSPLTECECLDVRGRGGAMAAGGTGGVVLPTHQLFQLC